MAASTELASILRDARAQSARGLLRMTFFVDSLRPDAGVLDHLAPHSELHLDEIAQFLRRAGESFEADVAEFCLNVGLVDDLAQRAVEPRHHRRRRAGRRNEAGPGVEVEAGQSRL